MSLRQRVGRLARDLEGRGLTGAEAMDLLTAVAETVKRHVTDRETLQAIAADFRRLATARGANQR
jgi:hypothetical protein